MGTGEDQPQPIVVDGMSAILTIDHHGLHVARDIRFHVRLTHEALGLLREPPVPPQSIDRPITGGGRNPCARVVGQSVAGPVFDGKDKGVLDRFFRDIGVVGLADERRDRPARFLTEQAVDELRGDLRGHQVGPTMAPLRVRASGVAILVGLEGHHRSDLDRAVPGAGALGSPFEGFVEVGTLE